MGIEQNKESQQPLSLDEQIAKITFQLSGALPIIERVEALTELARLRAARTMRDVFASSKQSENPET